MGLLTEYVEVILNGNMNNYYYNKGYSIPKNDKGKVPRGTRILVKVSDLPERSHKKVKVKCDCCGEEKYVTYDHYYHTNHDGKVYCVKCYGSIFRTGENNWKYKKEKTDEEREVGRSYPEYNEFIRKVMARDSNTCYICGKESKSNEVHHIYSYDVHKDLRTDETNGICLCKDCHKNFHMLYGRGNNTKEQFEEWIGHAMEELSKYEGSLPTCKIAYCVEDKEIIKNIGLYCKKNNIADTLIYSNCNGKSNSAYGKHYVWYEDYIKMTEQEIQELTKPKSKQFRKIICLNTLEVYDSLVFAKQKTGISKGSIYNCCSHKNKSAGGLKWMYYDEYVHIMKLEYGIA